MNLVVTNCVTTGEPCSSRRVSARCGFALWIALSAASVCLGAAAGSRPPLVSASSVQAVNQGGRVQITIQFNRLPRYRSLHLSDPERMVFDFFDSAPGPKWKLPELSKE